MGGGLAVVGEGKLSHILFPLCNTGHCISLSETTPPFHQSWGVHWASYPLGLNDSRKTSWPKACEFWDLEPLWCFSWNINGSPVGQCRHKCLLLILILCVLLHPAVPCLPLASHYPKSSESRDTDNNVVLKAAHGRGVEGSLKYFPPWAWNGRAGMWSRKGVLATLVKVITSD